MADSRDNPLPPSTDIPSAGAGKPGQKKADLKDLDLATGVDRLPELWARHGNKVLIGITILALGYALWSFKRNSALSARLTAETNLALTRDLLTELRAFPLDRETPENYGSSRRRTLSDGTTYLNEVLERAQDEVYVSQALLLRGDLNYTLAALPELEAATTRPAIGLGQPRDKLLGAAKESYSRVLESFPARTRDVGAARFGLAAIAEDMGDWEGAKKHYEAVANDDKQIKTYRDLAKSQLERLPELASPVRLRPASRPATMSAPTTGMTAPSTGPATMPTSTAPSQVP